MRTILILSNLLFWHLLSSPTSTITTTDVHDTLCNNSPAQTIKVLTDNAPANNTSRPKKTKYKSFQTRIQDLFAPNPFTAPNLSEQESLSLAIAIANIPGINSIPLPIIHTQLTENQFIQTYSGHAALIKAMDQPHSNSGELAQQQYIIDTLAADKKLLTDITTILKEIKNAEPFVLVFYRDAPLLDPDITKQLYWHSFLFRHFNKSVRGLEIGVRLNNIGTSIDLFYELYFILWFAQVSKQVSNFPPRHPVIPLDPNRNKHLASISISLKKYKDSFEQVIYQSLVSIKGKKLSYTQSLGFTTDLLSKFIQNCPYLFALHIIISADEKLTALNKAKTIKDSITFLQTQLIGVARYMQNVKKLYTLIHNNPTIADNVTFLPYLKISTKQSPLYSAHYNELVHLLSSNTFTGKASFFSISGRVLRVYALIQDKTVQAELAHVINTVGKLDILAAHAHKQVNSTPEAICI